MVVWDTPVYILVKDPTNAELSLTLEEVDLPAGGMFEKQVFDVITVPLGQLAAGNATLTLDAVYKKHTAELKIDA